MAQLGFDFNSFQDRVVEQQRKAVEEATKGLKALTEERDDVSEQIDQLVERRDDLDEKISRLHEFLAAETPLVDSPPAARGLQKAIKEIFNSSSGPGMDPWQGLEAVTVLAQEFVPNATENSVRQALRNLVVKGELQVRGKRGQREWAIECDEGPLSARDTDQESPDPSDERWRLLAEEGVHGGTGMGQGMAKFVEGIQHKRSVEQLRDHLCDVILSTLGKRPGGLDAKAIAWLIDQEKVTETDIQEAVRVLLQDGKVELAKGEDGNGQVVRLPVDPDSREGLKQVHVEGNPLFPGMDQPKHV